MTTRVLVTDSAQADLRELRTYLLEQFGKKSWADCLAALRANFKQIAQFPESGRIPDELASLDMLQFRQVISGKNRILYELRGDTAYVHLVCDTRRDLTRILLHRIIRSKP